jgi:hypothetical protein
MFGSMQTMKDCFTPLASLGRESRKPEFKELFPDSYKLPMTDVRIGYSRSIQVSPATSLGMVQRPYDVSVAASTAAFCLSLTTHRTKKAIKQAKYGIDKVVVKYYRPPTKTGKLHKFMYEVLVM